MLSEKRKDFVCQKSELIDTSSEMYEMQNVMTRIALKNR